MIICWSVPVKELFSSSASFRPEDGPEGKYSQRSYSQSREIYVVSLVGSCLYQITLNSRYSGDLCPIDVDTIDDAEDLGTCLTLKVRSLPKYALNDNHSAGWRNGQVVCEECDHRRE